MDTELARTFLEVNEAGSFVAAAERLNLTQSAVSLRIQTLEQHLGRPVFTRGKNGVSLTQAGMTFQRYAVGLVNFWEHARQELAQPSEFAANVTVGAEAGIWNRLLHRWIPWMRHRAPEVAVRAEHAQPSQLYDHLLNGTHDVGVMYTPFGRPGIVTEVLVEEDLILVSTDAGAIGPGDGAYVFVDWGARFRAEHRLAYPEFARSGLRVNLGTLGLTEIRVMGGSGYFPESLVRPLLADGELHRLEGAPIFKLPIYVSYVQAGYRDLIALVLEGFREIIDEATGPDDRSASSGKPG